MMTEDTRSQERPECRTEASGETGEFKFQPEDPGDSELSALVLENKRLREENERLKEYRASLPPKERMYDHIPLTVKQMDLIIGCLLAVLVVVVVLGLINR